MRVDWRCQQRSVQGSRVSLCSPHHQGRAQRDQAQPWKVQRAQGESPSCDGLSQPCCLCLGSILHGYHTGPLWGSQPSVCHQGFSLLCSSRAGKGFFCCKPKHSTHGMLQACCSAFISLEISQGGDRPCSLSPFLQGEMVQVSPLPIKFHSKRQKGAEQIFPLQELRAPCSLSHGREGQARLCAPCPHQQHQCSMQGSGDELC